MKETKPAHSVTLSKVNAFKITSIEGTYSITVYLYILHVPDMFGKRLSLV